MKFFLRIIDTWLRQQGIAYALYGADGQALNGSEAGALPAQFIPEEMNGRSCPFPYWICYPIHVNGEYCGCWCFIDDGWNVKDIFRCVVRMTEIACNLDENLED